MFQLWWSEKAAASSRPHTCSIALILRRLISEKTFSFHTSTTLPLSLYSLPLQFSWPTQLWKSLIFLLVLVIAYNKWGKGRFECTFPLTTSHQISLVGETGKVLRMALLQNSTFSDRNEGEKVCSREKLNEEEKEKIFATKLNIPQNWELSSDTSSSSSTPAFLSFPQEIRIWTMGK